MFASYHQQTTQKELEYWIKNAIYITQKEKKVNSNLFWDKLTRKGVSLK